MKRQHLITALSAALMAGVLMVPTLAAAHGPPGYGYDDDDGWRRPPPPPPRHWHHRHHHDRVYVVEPPPPPPRVIYRAPPPRPRPGLTIVLPGLFD